MLFYKLRTSALKKLPPFAVLGIALVTAGCHSAPPPPKALQLGWRPVETFTGQGNSQTDSFDIASTQWRIRWEVRAEAAGATGKFHVMVHSAISGRPLMEAIDQNGPGTGTAYLAENPRLYHLVVESNGVNWKMSVDEGVVSYAK